MYLLPVSAIATATVLVTGQGHHAADPAKAAASVTTEAAAATGPHDSTGSVQRQPVLSRSSERVDRSTPKHRAAPAAAKRSHSKHQAAAHQPKHRRAQVPTAPSNAARTVASAKHSAFNLPGRCLQWSREQADIPQKYGDAATAWKHATGRRPHGGNPPRGAAVYWTGGSHGYGHIAISVGHHKVRSSDAGGVGRVATVSINHLSKIWHLRYAGWANSINGYKIPGVAG
jgi:hypothetical protein